MTEINILNQLPLYIFWKDLDLRYMGANTSFLSDAGLISNSDIVGETDFEMPWKTLAKKYRTDDRNIIKNKSSLIISEDHIEISGKLSIATVNKKPLLCSRSGQLIGVIGVYSKISLAKSLPHVHIPSRQRQTLECLIQGLTARESAVKLGLSIRTVESYLNTLKAKFGCKNKTELIKKVLIEKLLPY